MFKTIFQKQPTNNSFKLGGFLNYTFFLDGKQEARRRNGDSLHGTVPKEIRAETFDRFGKTKRDPTFDCQKFIFNGSASTRSAVQPGGHVCELARSVGRPDRKASDRFADHDDGKSVCNAWAAQNAPGPVFQVQCSKITLETYLNTVFKVIKKNFSNKKCSKLFRKYSNT